MLMKRIVPCLDVCDGRVVKGVRFQNLRDAGDPVERAAAYEAQGADELAVLHVCTDASNGAPHRETIRCIRAELSIPLTAGGGVRSIGDVAALLDAGADKVSVNTAAVARPTLVDEVAGRFGRQCMVLAVDAARNDGAWEVVTHSGRNRTGRDALRWMIEATASGAGEILLTSWDRDGTRSGYDLDLVRAAAAAVNVPIIASGGAATAAHLAAAIEAGADAVLAASIFHDGEMTVGDIKDQLAKLGVEVRL
jgi:imidazoleglycerol phosphate synthase cyclase subunit